jgi:small subunit ribosomal protein S16
VAGHFPPALSEELATGRRPHHEPRSFFSMLKIRLRRGGATHAPFYRIVVSDSLKTPSAATVEQIGHYDPKKNPADVKIDRERVEYWVSKGAQLSPTVKSILKKTK